MRKKNNGFYEGKTFRIKRKCDLKGCREAPGMPGRRWGAR